MTNPALQARAGRNSPQQALSPEFSAGRGFLEVLQAAVAPGVTVKVADGGRGLISPAGLRGFIGANAGAAVLSLTATLRDPNGNVVQTETQGLAGSNVGVSFNLGQLLPEGYSLWLNTTVTAGVYGGDAVATYALVQTILVPIDPVDIATSVNPVVEPAAGHSKFVGSVFFSIYNRDTVNHDFEVYLVEEDGTEVLVDTGTVNAGALVNFLGGVPLVLNSGQKISARIPVPIATQGRTVTVFGACFETNLLVEG